MERVNTQVEASRRMKRLVSKRRSLQLAAIQNEERLKRNTARQDEKLKRALRRAEEHYNEKLDRQAKSKLYSKSHLLYAIASPAFAVGRGIKYLWRKGSRRAADFRERRPNRSFYLTPAGSVRRGIKMRGYLSFVGEVWSFIWDNRRLFLKFIGLYMILSVLIIGVSQSSFDSIRESLEKADFNEWTKWPTLLAHAMFSSTTLTTEQTVMAALLLIYGALALIWLMRELLNGNSKLNLRDGLYNGGAPVLSIMALLLLLAIQMIPFGLGLFVYQAMASVGVIDSGINIGNMAAWCALAIVAVMSLYWIMATIMAIPIATLPGMYPMRAYSRAGDLVIGRRMQILWRVLIMLIPIALLWLAVMIPVVIFDSSFELPVPLVAWSVLVLTTVTILWCTCYLYLLYRHIVDDPTPIPVREPKVPLRERFRRQQSKKAVDDVNNKITKSASGKKDSRDTVDKDNKAKSKRKKDK